MAIEKMFMVDMVGHLSDLDEIVKSVVLTSSVHPVSAFQEIDTTDFTLSTTENNIDALIDTCYIRPYSKDRDYSAIEKKVTKLKDLCSIAYKSDKENKDYISDYNTLKDVVEEINNKFFELHDKLTEKINLKEKNEKLIQGMEFLKELNLPLDQLEELKNFDFKAYKVSQNNMLKLKGNYENIPSVVMSIYKEKEYEIVITFTPNLLIKETERIFKSLNCEEIDVSGSYKGTPKEIKLNLQSEVKVLEREIEKLNKTIKDFWIENEEHVKLICRSLDLQIKCEEIKSYMAVTREFFYLCGWVPESKLNLFKEYMGRFESKLIIIEKKSEEIKNANIIPPTKLKNNSFVSPFETMVNMYGVPSYSETDPTTFLGITYMIMFGAMFGDVGQGLVFFFAGLLIKYKKNKANIGDILVRLGASSTVFGFCYGSLFGFEEVIPALVVRPMEDIKDVLLGAIVFGCALLIIGFIYSLINSVKRKDLENGLFGKDGLTGLVFYVLLLTFAATKVAKIETMPTNAWIIIFVVLLTIMFLKQPIANFILKKRPLFNEDKKDYFIEGGFGVVETLLSMFSNTVSFIRVGAFALNHVGLFIAFAAMANMMHGAIGSTFMYVLGNVIIIGLEGLIVFIQGLRLEYYELFSKYYEGAGVPFEPIILEQ